MFVNLGKEISFDKRYAPESGTETGMKLQNFLMFVNPVKRNFVFQIVYRTEIRLVNGDIVIF